MWLAPCGMVQLVSRLVFWGDSEYAPKIFIADLYPLLQTDQSRYWEMIRWPCLNDLIYTSSVLILWVDSGSEKGIHIFHLWLLIQLFQCSNPKIRLTMSEPTCNDPYIIWDQISRQFWIWSQNFKFPSVSCIIVILLLVKLDSAIADVPTNTNMSTAGIH